MATFYNDLTPNAWECYLQQESFIDDITSYVGRDLIPPNYSRTD
ncbi:MAG: hypothetical protein P9X24_05845 [Candidatus Hatepunaea meridiana]|nr:hypothetical protein [Candidatus Hatepunaea meridiana]